MKNSLAKTQLRRGVLLMSLLYSPWLLPSSITVAKTSEILPLSKDFQEREIKGRVLDENKKPLPGATVAIKGSTKKVSTNENGAFVIQSSAASDVLVVSFIGYEPTEQMLREGQAEQIIITLKPDDDTALDEVVVVGYGSQRKQDVTGAVSSVSAQSIAEVPVTQPSQALQGRAAGVFVTNTNNKPGGAATVRIRGNRSFSAGNDPLYVIDGIPITGGLEDIPPQDIASMEVLKDASA